MWNLSRNIISSLNTSNLNFFSYIIIFILLILAINFLSKFIKIYNKNIYSVKMVNYMSITIFLILLSISILVPTDKVYNENFVSISNTSVLMLYVPITVFLIFLLISNILLIIKKGYSQKNKINLMFIITFILSEYLLYKVALAEDTLMLIVLSEVIGGICLYFLSIFIGTIVTSFIFYISRPKYNKDFIIILGCKCTSDFKPSSLLKKRLDTALNFYYKQLQQKIPKKAVFIVSGGKGTLTRPSEAQVMKKYLIDQGIPENQIIIEDKAINTYQNMKFCKKIIQGINKEAKSVFVTNGFHLFRSSIFADINKLNASGLSSKSETWYYSMSTFIMEYKGVFDTYRKQNLKICTYIILICVIIGYIFYFYNIY